MKYDYVINSVKSNLLTDKYRKLSLKGKNVIFCEILVECKYYYIDDVIKVVFDCVRNELNDKEKCC